MTPGDTLLWGVLAAFTFLTLAWVTRPLWRGRSPGQEDADHDARLAVLRDRRAEIDAEEQSGRLDAAAAEDARRELVDTLAVELAQERRYARGGERGRHSELTLVFAVIAAIVAWSLYSHVGQPDIEARLAEATTDAHRNARRVAELAAEARAELAADPDNAEAWVALAQINAMRGDFPTAIDAYEQAVGLLPPNARLLADFAETVALSQDRAFAGRPLALLERAIAIDPDDPKTNGLLGAALFQAGRSIEAIPHLEKVLATLPPASDQARQIGSLIAELRRQSDADSTSASRPSDGGSTEATASTSPAVDGSITISGVTVSPDDTLFVSIRAADGPRMPFVARRIAAPTFPLEISLGDQDLMTPSRPLPRGSPLVLEARLSGSGQALRQPGDRFGTSAPFTLPMTEPLQVTIDDTVQ